MGVMSEITLTDVLLFEAIEADIADLVAKKRKAPAKLNGPTRDECKRRGWDCELVEHYDSRTMRKHDLLGFVDFLAFGDGETIALQVTSKANMAARIKKIESDDLAKQVAKARRSGWRILVWGFYKQLNGRWAIKETDVS